jgi:hypothetical protein
MKQLLNDALEFFSFLLLMAIIGFGAILYSLFVAVYYLYAKLTGQEHLIK